MIKFFSVMYAGSDEIGSSYFDRSAYFIEFDSISFGSVKNSSNKLVWDQSFI